MSNNTINVYEEAAKQHLRFPSVKGDLTVEQLFDLPLTTERSNAASLDNVARDISRKLREQQEDSFVTSRPNPIKSMLTLQLEVVKAVIARKQADNAEAAARAARQARRRAIEDALATKDATAIANMDADALRAELASLQD